MKDELLQSGAEAQIWKTTFLTHAAAYKKRVPKNYRINELDLKIRSQRIQTEVNLLHKAKLAGVRTPVVYGIDQKNAGFWMEFLGGTRFKDELNSKIKNSQKFGKNGQIQNKKTKNSKLNSRSNSVLLCSKAGEMIAKLHSSGLVHGDLTTSNFIVEKNELVLFDFGLGFFSGKTEDFSTDLLNLKKTFGATHPFLQNEWKALLASYEKNFVAGKNVVKQMAAIEKRARYY